MSVIQASDLDYSHKTASHSSPLFIKLTPLNNQTTITLNLASVYGPIQFVVPSKCCNLAKSIIQFDVAVPAQGGGNYAWFSANMWDLFYRTNTVGQSTNTQLQEISPVDRFASSLIPVSLKQKDFLIKPSPIANGATFTTAAIGQAQPLAEVSRNWQTTNIDGLGNDTLTPYDGLQKCLSSTATNTATYFTVSMELGSLPFNIFSLDKMMYYGSEQLEINLYMNPVNRWCWLGTGAANPNTASAAATGTFTVQNISLYLNTEQDAKIIEGLVQKTMTTGYSINFAYPLITRQALSGNNQSINTQLTRGYGKSLLFIGTSWYCGTTAATFANAPKMAITAGETNATAIDHSLNTILTNGAFGGGNFTNTAGYSATGAFSSFTYQAQIDSINILTNNQYNPYLGEHFLYNKDHLVGSAIKSLPQYNIEFVHLDNFCGDAICDIDMTVEDGLSLENYRQHQMTFTANPSSGTAASVNWYCFYICQRTLNLSSQGLLVT